MGCQVKIMIVDLSHKIRLNPTAEQVAYFDKACWVARDAWNWGLSEYNARTQAGEKVKITGKGSTLKQEFASIKAERFPHANDVTTHAYQQSFIDLQTAVSNYFRRLKNGELKTPSGWRGRRDGRPFGWPRFKSRYRDKPSFYESNQGLRFDGYSVRFPRIGWINATEPLRFDGKVMGGRVSYSGGYWWLSVSVRMERDDPVPPDGSIGVDFGVKYLAVISDGVTMSEYQNPRPTYANERKLRRLQRKLDRQLRASNPENYNEDGTARPSRDCGRVVYSNKALRTKRQIDRLHTHVANVRADAAHKLTSEIANNYGVIAVEDLNIRGMMKNRHLAKAVSDAAMYEKRRQLTYKSALSGGIVIPVSRWFPSSKTCSSCGWVNIDLKLSDREWVCQDCGCIHHRDENAAENIRIEGLRVLVEMS